MTTAPVPPIYPASASLVKQSANAGALSFPETPHNHLLSLLPVKERNKLLAVCKTVNLELGQVLCEAGQPTLHAYFPINGYISLIASGITGAISHDSLDAEQHADMAVEVGMVGREGLVGSELVLGVARSPLQALVQGPGLALQITASAFKRQLALSPLIRRHFLRYVYVLMAQQATAATCLRFHQIGPRLARWLLMSQDRAHSNHFHLTQEFLAHMLGVRRVGVTAAASALQKQGLIAYRRGQLQVLNRDALEAAACPCYDIDSQQYANIL